MGYFNPSKQSFESYPADMHLLLYYFSLSWKRIHLPVQKGGGVEGKREKGMDRMNRGGRER